MKHSKKLCRKIAGLLSEYLDEELDPASCSDVVMHMKDCAPCVDFLESLRITVEVTRQAGFSSVQAPPISDDVREKLKQLYETFRAK